MILDVARQVSRIMARRHIRGAVIGGIAVVLHGHVRTTKDVDVFAPEPIDDLADALRAGRFEFDRRRREFVKSGVPVHLVTLEQLGREPRSIVEIDHVATVSLADLIDMKLRSGLSNPLRAQDLADVIGLIRHHRLRTTFAAALDRSVRTEFRKLAKAVREQG
ncbi:MAG: DUF6036 family nucleotidyltransferase [Phycisphaerae bacterium]